ncbi:tonB-dependent Receptor Plug domain protein [Bordetella holmesii 35009]|nr:tonB-dependent Receptor Plug domain protein [Bordetella holmesii 35009]
MSAFLLKARLPARPLPYALACASLLVLQPSHAQSDPATAATLAPVIVTGNPLGSEALSIPSTVLSGDALDLRRADSLGETLNGLPGISTTTYGPMVGRPIIRGMDGDRVRLLSNGVGTLDASSLSYDHQVPNDPMASERIEILRGPAALLYGVTPSAAWSTPSTTASPPSPSTVFKGRCRPSTPAPTTAAAAGPGRSRQRQLRSARGCLRPGYRRLAHSG